METTARLLVRCPDKPGIVAAVANFMATHGANITDLDQHSSHAEDGTFFMRLEFQTPHIDTSLATLETRFADEIAKPYNMDWHISHESDKKRMAILVSKVDHALLELLWRAQRGELAAEIPMVISNHRDLEKAVTSFDIPFHNVPVSADNKPEAEAKILELLGDKIDLVVLARYMQILSADFIAHYPHKIINIHHSFLPAFVGANPYKQAYDKGVKLIGATAHYVTADLDQGPIIDQDVRRVTHRLDVKELKELGCEVERSVLARAVKWHLQDRIIVDGNKTVVLV